MFWYLGWIFYAPMFFIFFRKIRLTGGHKLRRKEPVLIAMNHPNSFLDPMVFSWYLTNPKVYYMARGDAFKGKLVSRILDSVGIVPIFRMRDMGIEGVKQNRNSFRIIFEKFRRGKKVIVFAEGLCVNERRLRPVQKGSARMALGFMEETGRNDLYIAVAGINYRHPQEFHGFVDCKVGDLIRVSDYFELYKENPAKGVNELTRAIEEKLTPLVPHLKHPSNDELAETLHQLHWRTWMHKHRVKESDPANHTRFWHWLTETLNNATSINPDLVDGIKLKVKQMEEILKSSNLNIQDLFWVGTRKSSITFFDAILLLLAGPFYFLAFIWYYFPKTIAINFSWKKCKHIEFVASTMFVVMGLLINLQFIIELILVYVLFHSGLYLLYFLVMKILIGVIGLWYRPRFKNLVSLFRYRQLRKNNPMKLKELEAIRQAIITELEPFS